MNGYYQKCVEERILRQMKKWPVRGKRRLRVDPAHQRRVQSLTRPNRATVHWNLMCMRVVERGRARGTFFVVGPKP